MRKGLSPRNALVFEVIIIVRNEIIKSVGYCGGLGETLERFNCYRIFVDVFLLASWMVNGGTHKPWEELGVFI